MIQLPASLLSGVAFAAVGALAAVIVAMAATGLGEPVKSYLRFAAALTAAVAAAGLFAALGGRSLASLAVAVQDLVAALVPAALALAALTRYLRPLPALASTAALAIACTAGLFAAALDSALLGYAPLVVCALVIAVLAARAWPHDRRSALLLGLGAGAFVAAASSSMGGGAEGRIGFMLFFAAGQLGIALAIARRSDLAVDSHARSRPRAVFIRRKD